MCEEATAYEVLRVGRGSSEGAIRAAYKRRLLATHPDRGGSRGEYDKVRAAYDLLRAAPDARERGVVAEEIGVAEMQRTSGGWFYACRCGEGYALADGAAHHVVVTCSGCSLAVKVVGARGCRGGS